MDKLTEMITAQANLQERLGINFDEMTADERQKYIEKMYIAAIRELGEALDETPWKFWSKNQLTNAKAFAAELSDTFQFIINMWLAMMGPAVEPRDIAGAMHAMMMKKITINNQRIDAGYDGKKGKCQRCKRAIDDPAVRCWRIDDQGYCAYEDADYNVIRDTVSS